MILALIYDRYLIYGHIRNPIFLIAEVENAILDIHDVTAKCGVRAAVGVDLLSQKLIEQFFHTLKST